MKRIFNPLLLFLLIFGGATAWAVAPTYYGQVIMNAAQATPTPAPTGFYGPTVVAQATNAPTAQPGNTNITGTAFSGTGVKTADTATATLSYVAPVYTVSGGSIGSSLHQVLGTISATANGACTPVAICALNSSAVTFSGAGVFSATPICTVEQTAVVNGIAYPSSVSTSGFTASLYYLSGATITNGSSVTFSYSCIGV